MSEEEKRAAHRPLLFKSVDEVEKKINEYFAWAEEKEKPLTLERLAVFLKTTTRTIRNYQRKEEYFEVIEAARQAIYAEKVERLNTRDGNTPGIIFDLCNNSQDDYSNKRIEDNKTTTIIINDKSKEI